MLSPRTALETARTQLGRTASANPNDQLTTDVAHLILNGASGTLFTDERQVVTVVNGQAIVRPVNPHAFS